MQSYEMEDYSKLWAQLRCNYGVSRAHHVPEAIRMLFESWFKSSRRKAYWKLENHIITQGYLEESAPYALDLMFLHWKQHYPNINYQVMQLLCELAGGYSDYSVQVGPYKGEPVEKLTRMRLTQFIPDLQEMRDKKKGKWRSCAMDIVSFYEGEYD